MKDKSFKFFVIPLEMNCRSDSVRCAHRLKAARNRGLQGRPHYRKERKLSELLIYRVGKQKLSEGCERQEMENSTADRLPEGLVMAFAHDTDALVRFTRMSNEAQDEIIRRAANAKTERDMKRLLKSIPYNTVE